jgi:hypothetical protein
MLIQKSNIEGLFLLQIYYLQFHVKYLNVLDVFKLLITRLLVFYYFLLPRSKS